jgi:hypothetical protein
VSRDVYLKDWDVSEFMTFLRTAQQFVRVLLCGCGQTQALSGGDRTPEGGGDTP